MKKCRRPSGVKFLDASVVVDSKSALKKFQLSLAATLARVRPSLATHTPPAPRAPDVR
jgi:hypothetical protein